jgi:thioredoxin reductase
MRRWRVLDGGEPRNAPSSGVGGFLPRDGIRPRDLPAAGREQPEPYPSVEVRQGRALGASGESVGFEMALEDGSGVTARKIVLATGVADELPARPGFEEHWGRGVYNCPY